MKNKKSQFYIVAAIIIVLILSSMASVITYVIVKSEPKTIKDISSDLKEEYPRIIDYGVYNGVNLTSLLTNFTEKDFASYFLHKTDYANVTFIFGNGTDEKLNQVSYVRQNTGSINLASSGIKFFNTVIEKGEVESYEDVPGSGYRKVKVKIFDKDFEFDLTENEVFYFVITKEKEGEVFVEKNQ